MSYRHICEPCRKALDLPAADTYLNRIKRRDGGFSTTEKPPRQPPEVFKRDSTGKPLIIGRRLSELTIANPAQCTCRCAENDHDPRGCTGEDDFLIDGRPGSGAVDATAQVFGIEPNPEMVAAMHEQVAALVRVVLALLKGDTDEERLAIENEYDGGSNKGYSDQIKELRGLLLEKMPDRMKDAPYKDLSGNLKKLAKFRNDKVSHSWPVGGNWLSRVKRKNGQWETFMLTAEEVAVHMDLAFNLISQLTFLPNYVLPPANDDPDAIQRLADWLSGNADEAVG